MSETLFDRKKEFDTTVDSRALLKKLKEQETPVKNLRKDIPSGELIPELLVTEEDISEAVYAWLRTSSKFNSMEICFAANPETYKVDKVRVHNYDINLPKEPWFMKAESLRELRDVVTRNIIKYKNIVRIAIEKSGVTFFLDSEKKFAHMKKATAKEVAAINEANKKAQENNPELKFETLVVGTEIPNPEYKPWIGWTTPQV